MPIPQYYNPYRRPIFYNKPYRTNYTPNPISKPVLNNSSNYSPNQTINHSQNYEPFSSSVNTPNVDFVTKSSETSYNRSSCSKSKIDENVWLDLFGIKLYFDDVLILSLLFFLYKEEVKDEGLFLALVLLLIS